MRRLPWFAVAWIGLVLCGAAAGLRAQNVSFLIAQGDAPLASADVTLHPAGSRPGGLTFAVCQVANLADRPQQIELEASSRHWEPGDVRVHRTEVLAPGERVLWHLPLPTPGSMSWWRFAADGTEQQRHVGVTQHDALCGLWLSDRADSVSVGAAVLGGIEPGTIAHPFSDPPQLVPCSPAAAPADWRLFTGFPLVMVDGRAPLTAAQQEALRRYAFAGGNVLVATPAALPAGPLRELGEAALVSPEVSLGLGKIVALPAFTVGGERLRAGLARFRFGDGPWPAAMPLLVDGPIPGLGDAPVLLFLLVILLFAIGVGPVNFLWLRRRNRPLLVLVTVPVLGFGTTLAILVFGFLQDGIGVRGVTTSWSWLDQRRHEVAVVAQHTLFAGVTPGAVAIGPDDLLLAPRASYGGQRELDAWHLDAGTGELDGVLPSRQATALLGARQAVARQRLLGKYDGDALLLSGEGGVVATGQVVLRDFDGTFWTGDAPRLVRSSPAQVAVALAGIAGDGDRVVLLADPFGISSHRHQGGVSAGPESQSVGVLAGRLFAAELPPGSYVARLQQPAWLPLHGLRIDHDQERHFVRGQLAAEDLQR